jgi:hypothetical protein
VSSYRSFLQEARTAQLREGRDGVRLVGEGLLVPHLTAFDWEAVFRNGAELPAPWQKAQNHEEATSWRTS